MKKRHVLFLSFILGVCLAFLLVTYHKENVVVVYVAHDQDYSEPILKEFEKQTGIKVKALYDTEATKTVGLVNRLLAEKNNPQADVFWNNEVMRSILLKELGILQPYCSPNAKDIPEFYKDPECYWTGFAARARVIIYNTEKIKENPPTSIFDFTDPKWKGKACIANPLLGTTSTHFAALFAALGDEKAKELLVKMKENDVKVVESNSMVRDQVVVGECWFGLTDTDDAYDAIREEKPVSFVFPDQKNEQIGDLIIPNTVMLIKNSPHPENGKKLIDFLLTPEVEEKLAKIALQMPLKNSTSVPQYVPRVSSIKRMNVSYYQIFEKMNVSNQFIQENFLS
ncbi:MAG: extracellular solute-binding protein [Candidatus Aenigmarchaeota archaeon]|nr:extracellular solute-binding protein [Candidatus Aenigmarchaeota archaeon]